jgi:hypothetical protein
MIKDTLHKLHDLGMPQSLLKAFEENLTELLAVEPSTHYNIIQSDKMLQSKFKKQLYTKTFEVGIISSVDTTLK